MNIFNQFSYPLIAVGVLIFVFLLVRRCWRPRWYIIAGIQLAIILSFAAGFFILRPGSTNVDSAEIALATIGNGRPTFVEFFSNYCTGCLAVEPTIDSLKQDIENEFNFLRINIHTGVGRALRQSLGFSFTPEFILFDPAGNEVWRSHAPPSQTELDRARNPESP